MYRWLWLLLPLAAVPVVGLLYQYLGGLNDRRRYARLGTMVNVGHGRRLYMSRMGSGGPTVIFESGIAATSQNWLRLQQAVSEFACTVSYDRSGLGWSSPATTERTPSNVVRELRVLLQEAGIAPPYVLVGHSFGGLVVRRFATEHPKEVVGVLLLDAMRTEEWPPVNEKQIALLAKGVRMSGFGVPFARFGLARLALRSLLCRSGRLSGAMSRAAGNGGLHVLDRITCEVGKMPREVWPIVAAHWAAPSFYRGLSAHVRAVPATVRDMHEAAAITGVPVLLLTAGTAEPLSDERLRAIGPEAEQIIAEGSGHWVHLDDQELVLDAIRGMVEGARAGAQAEAELVETQVA